MHFTYKARHLARALVLACLFMVPLFARAENMSLGAFGTYHKFDDWGENWGAGAKWRLDFAKYLGVDVRGSWIRLEDLRADLVPVEVTLLAQLPLPDGVTPYIGIGGGYYFFLGDESAAEDNAGFYPLVGVELAFGESSNWSMFVEARWLFLETDVDAAWDSARNYSDANMDALGINFGISLRF